jgi:hypothetical protein
MDKRIYQQMAMDLAAAKNNVDAVLRRVNNTICDRTDPPTLDHYAALDYAIRVLQRVAGKIEADQ